MVVKVRCKLLQLVATTRGVIAWSHMRNVGVLDDTDTTGKPTAASCLSRGSSSLLMHSLLSLDHSPKHGSACSQHNAA
eukprot:2024286-Amphidinium_carterae.1